MPYAALGIIFSIISISAIAITVYDKIAARESRRNRVSENTLLMIAAFGGSVAMYITMLIIRHKTKHKKFMTGLPVIIIIQAVIIFAIYYFMVM